MPRHTLSEFDKKIRKEISYNLKMHTRGLTQAELSLMTGIPTSTLSGYFSERSTISDKNVQKIADALGLDKRNIDPRFEGTKKASVMEEQLLNYFNTLNQIGKEEALKRIEELTYLAIYTE